MPEIGYYGLAQNKLRFAYVIVPDLYDAVLRWPATLSAEHAVYGGSQMRHGQGVLGEAQFSGVLVHLVVL